MASIIKTDNIQKVSDDSNIIKKCGSTTTVGSGAGNTITVDGATVTLGRCGGTVNLASGATQSGFGRSGSVNWCTTAKTSPFTAANGIGYFINTTSGAVTVTLPASPSAGDIVAVQDYANTAQTNNITVARNSSKIDGRCVDGTISVNGEAYTLVYVDGTEGWKTVDNTTQQIDTASFVAATGGNAVVTCGNFKIHVFTSTGALCVSNAGNSTGSNSLEYMVVGGGGGGGRNIPAPNVYGAGGGGAGGWRASSGASPSGPFTAGPAPLVGCVASIPVSVQPYPVTIGAGGAASGGNSNGTSGSNTIFSTITSAGGGGGGGGNQNPGVDGGSGGGGGTGPSPGANSRPGGAGNTPPVSPPQGNTGGTSSYRTATNFSGGGGGGAGAVGSNGSGNCGGLGGTGVGTAIIPNSAPTQPSYGASGPDATLRYFAGGGSGAGLTNATSDPSRIPVGGGGAAGGEYPVGTNVTNGVAGTANTGGGGGAGSTTATAGAGGSGVVLIRYKFQ
jgi:hypothetical protein